MENSLISMDLSETRHLDIIKVKLITWSFDYAMWSIDSAKFD